MAAEETSLSCCGNLAGTNLCIALFKLGCDDEEKDVMRLDVDVKSIRVIPKSVLKIGVKLPEVGGGSKSTPDLSRKGDG